MHSPGLGQSLGPNHWPVVSKFLSSVSCVLKLCASSVTGLGPIFVGQRFCTQHQVKLGKLENIFLTQLHADTLGGLLGMYLTLADSGNRRLSIRGPPGVSHFLSAGKAFCENRQDSELRAEEIDMQTPTASLLRDNFVSIQPIPVTPCPSHETPTEDSGGATTDVLGTNLLANGEHKSARTWRLAKINPKNKSAAANTTTATTTTTTTTKCACALAIVLSDASESSD